MQKTYNVVFMADNRPLDFSANEGFLPRSGDLVYIKDKEYECVRITWRYSVSHVEVRVQLKKP